MKNKKIKQLFALVMASVMCLSACGNNQTKPSTSTEGSATNSSASSGETVQEPEVKNYWDLLDEVSDSSELPDWTGEKLEVNVWVAGGTDAMFGTISDTNVVMKEIERVTGITFNVDECFGNGGDSVDAKLPKLVASKDFPTLIYGWNIDKVLNDLWENGYLADLTEYYMDGTLDHMLHWLPLEEFDQALYSSMRDDEGRYYKTPYGDVRNYCLTAGYTPEEFDPVHYSTYGMTPVDQTNQYYSTALYVRDDILQAMYPDAHSTEELKKIYLENGSFTREQIYDVPLSSPEDVVNFLYEVQEFIENEEYVGLDGKKVEVTYGPHTGTDNWDWMFWLPSLSRFFPRSDYFAVAEKNSDDDLLIEWAVNSEPTIEWMKTLNKLVNDDVIVKDSLVDNQATFEEKYNNGHYAVTYGKNASQIDGSGAGWAYRPVWVDGDAYTHNYCFAGLPQKYSFSVFKDAVPEDQMDQLMHYFDFMCSEVGCKLLFWGPASAGLFVEDAEGNRSYIDKELEQAMIYKVDSDLPRKYGLRNPSMTDKAFDNYVLCGAETIYAPSYIAASKLARKESDVFRYFNPGTLPGESFKENAISVVADQLVYSLGLSVEGINQFWNARAGFENQVKKVIVAASEAEFDKQLADLRQYTVENGLTDEALKEYNELFIEKNREMLKAAGIID